MIRILHLITSLEVGGAESTLIRLAQGIDRTRFAVSVVNMTSEGPLAAPLIEAGIPVYNLNMRRGRINPLAFWRLLGIIKRERPDILQSWLYHADLLALLARVFSRTRRLAWNIRCSNIDLREYNRLTSFVLWLLARLSPLPDVVVVNSYAGKKVHQYQGYTPKRWEVIDNGIDLERFKPDARAREDMRRSWKIAPTTPVIGVPARYDPMKGHHVLLDAVRLLRQTVPDVRVVLVGDGTKTVRSKGIISLDRRLDLERIYPAFDVVCLPSIFGEGFPNVIGEAMACGVPVVATDVGDSARIVGDTGWIVPPGDAPALAQALAEALTAPSPERGQAGRTRITEHFTSARMIAAYEALYSDLAPS